jgi:8-oxo-dGTP pyrophosphatase MutT (NUDIX family)
MAIDNRKEWLSFARDAWSAAGQPEGLDPALVETLPIEYDASYYRYFERRFFDLWMIVYRRVKPAGGTLIKDESAEFQDAWRRNFSWETIWKQLLPLFVYGGAIGVDNHVLVELASYYAIAQAIPSTVIDRILDEPGNGTVKNDAAFCMQAYIKGLSGLRALELSFRKDLEDCFVKYTREMYGIMLTEHGHRFVEPPSLPYEEIESYFEPKSRLLSSIFLGVLPRWAYLLADKAIPAAIEESFDALRVVRQLNDELSDIESDLADGLITLPWLYALEEAPELRGLISTLWQHPESPDSREACLRCLRKTQGMQRACNKSLARLTQSMDATRANFAVGNCFDITVLHNIRWAHVMRIIQNGYRDIPSPQQPSLPHSTLTSNPNPVIPVAGAGSVVVNQEGKVLMSLILKRGMLRWELPAGAAKDGESMEQAAKRETLEETGRIVDVGDAIALCWHYSREMGKGWMGIFFNAHVSGANTEEDFRVINLSALEHMRINLVDHPELYGHFELKTYNFEILRNHWISKNPRPAAHENIIACGFVDWRCIPEGRIHPLHRELLEAHQLKRKIDLLVRDADTDIALYDQDAPLYRP